MWEPLISKWLNLTLHFKRSISEGGFRLRHCEHAELKWCRVVSSSGHSYRRCWIIKCGFYYTRRLTDEFSELVIARTKCLLFCIHDARGVRACVLVNLHTTQSRISVNTPTVTYFQALNLVESLLTCFISQSACPNGLHTHVHKQAAWCLGSMRLAATMHKRLAAVR